MGLMDMFGGAGSQSKADSQPEDMKKLAEHVKSKVEEVRASASRTAHEGIWMTNIAYLLGYDGIAFNTQTRQFVPINRASSYLKKNRIHVNKILPTIQNRLARLCKNPPKYDVRPESNDTEDKEAARLGLQTLTALWESLSLDEKRIFLYMWVQQCGHAYVKVAWDPTLGRLIQEADGSNMFEGDIRVDVTSPFEIFPDPLAKTFEEAKRSWIIQAKVRKLDYFRAQYKEYGHLVTEEQAWLLSTQYESRINAMNSRGPASSGMSEAMKNCAIELTKYEARSEKYPNGRMIVCAAGILLEDKDLPVGEIPFAKFDDTVIGGKYYSESVITHLRPIQDAYNENRRRVTEWSRTLMAGKYTAARGSGVAPESPNDQSGEFLFYDPVPNAPDGGRPSALTPPSLPQWAFQEESVLTSEINDISGISEVSRGTLPSASIPAIGMQLLTEQDDTRIGVMTELHERSWAHIGGLILKYVEKFYILPRKLKIAGKNLQYTVKEIQGDMLRGNTDVIVIRGSTVPGSKTLRNEEIMNRFNAGLLGDPADPKVREKVLSMTEFGDVAEIWQDYGLDMQQIRRGIEAVEAGEVVEVSEFDNHALWMQEINRYRKGDKWSKIDPVMQGEFLRLIEEHLNWIVQMTTPPPDPSMMPPPMPEESVPIEQIPDGGVPPIEEGIPA